MKISTQRWLDQHIGPLICSLIDGLYHLSFKKNHHTICRDICIILLSEMGSISVTFPMIQRIRQKYPLSRVYILTLEKNAEIIKTMNLLPENNIITINDNSFKTFIKDTFKAIRQLRSIPIDTVIDCELFSRISSIFSYASGAKIRVGFHPHTQEGLYRGNHLNCRVLYNPYLHISIQFLNMVNAIESKEHPKNKETLENQFPGIPRIEIRQEEIKNLKDRIESRFPQFLTRPAVLMNPGGGELPIRAWPIENYCTVARSFLDAGFSIGITGIGRDKKDAEKISNSCQSIYCADMVNFTRSVKELLVLFSISKLLITNDGGPGHFSTLVSLPSIIMYGPETHILYGSLNPNAINLNARISCSPCLTAYNHRNSPCNGNNLCLKAIKPDQVLKHAYAILKSHEPI